MGYDVGEFREFEAAGWEEVAASYAASDVVAGLMGRAGRLMVDAVGAAPGRRVLDLACGPGWASSEAARRGAEVAGVDLAAGMVAAAEQTVPGVVFRQAPAEALPFADGSFDGVMCGFGLPHFADPDAALAETVRVLRPGGRIAFTTWCTPDKVPFFGVVFTAVVEHGTLEVELPEGPDMFRFATEREAVESLGRLGLQDVSVTELPLEVEVADPALAMEVVLRGTVRTRALVRAQSAEAQAAIAEAVAAAVNGMRREGRVVVPMPAVLLTATRP